MTDWNPDSPATLGLQWFPKANASRSLDAISKSVAALIPSTITESIDSISFHLATPALAPTSTYTVEIYELDDVIAGSSSQSTFRPNEDVAGVNISTSTMAGSVSSHIDESTLDTSDYGTNTADGDMTLDFRVSVGTGNLTGRRILSVSLATVAARTGLSAGLWHALVLGGNQYIGGSILLSDAAALFVTDWPVNPSTGAPWTIAEVEALDTTDEVRLFTTGGPDAGSARLYQAYVVVTHVAENRLAVGSVDLASQTGWVTIDLLTPTGGSSWSKAAGVDYLAVLHRSRGSGTAPIRTLDSGATPPGRDVSYAPILAGEAGLISALGNQSTGSVPFVLTTNAAAASLDSQPYATLDMEDVHTGRTVQGEITGVVGSYGLLRALVAQQAAEAAADLTVRLRRRSDNTIMATATITSDDLTFPRINPQEVVVNFAVGATLAAVQYYLEFSSTADEGEGWEVGVLNTEGTSAAPSFGGTTDRATVAGVESSDLDVAATIATQPAAPADFAVVIRP